jgi:hypothetical protein
MNQTDRNRRERSYEQVGLEGETKKIGRVV